MENTPATLYVKWIIDPLENGSDGFWFAQPEPFEGSIEYVQSVEIMHVHKLNAALVEFYNSIPGDVLRMKAGNAWLDMERVDNARIAVHNLLHTQGDMK